MDKFRQDKINALYREIAKHFKIPESTFLHLSKSRQYEMLDEYLKNQEKKAKKRKASAN